jgi:hypothetical protein
VSQYGWCEADSGSGFDILDFERAQHRMQFIGKGLKEERYAVDLTGELIKYS